MRATTDREPRSRHLPRVLVVLAALAALLPGLLAPAYAAVPGAPTDVRSVGGANELTVSFLKPLTDGGRAITGYEVSLNGSPWLPLSTSTGNAGRLGGTVGGLASGTSYLARIRALNADGSSAVAQAPAAVRTSGTPATLSFATYPGDGQVLVYFGQTPGAPGTVRRVTAVPLVTTDPVTPTRSTTCAASATTCTVTGLVNDTHYRLVVASLIALSAGDLPSIEVPGESRTVEDVVPSARPQAPTGLTVRSLDRAVDLTWKVQPIAPFGATDKVFEARVGTTWVPLAATGSNGTFTARLTKLVNGTTYDVAVRAVRGESKGRASQAAPVKPAGRPSAPRAVKAVATGTAAVVRWRAPRSTGGSPVVRYVVTASGTERGCTATTTRTCTVTGLVAGARHVFSVTADNTAAGLAGTGVGPVARSRAVTVPRG